MYQVCILVVGSGVAQKSPKPDSLPPPVHLQFHLKILSSLEVKIVLSFQCIFFESGSKGKTPTYLVIVYFVLVEKTKLNHLGSWMCDSW